VRDGALSTERLRALVPELLDIDGHSAIAEDADAVADDEQFSDAVADDDPKKAGAVEAEAAAGESVAGDGETAGEPNRES
jgi:hypothetical protein